MCYDYTEHNTIMSKSPNKFYAQMLLEMLWHLDVKSKTA